MERNVRLTSKFFAFGVHGLFNGLFTVCSIFVICLNPLIPGGNKKGHTYLNKPAALSCRFV